MAILKKLSVGDNQTSCNLEAWQKSFFQFFLIFTKPHFNDQCTQSNIVSERAASFQNRRYCQFGQHRIREYLHHFFKCLSDSNNNIINI